MKSPPRSKVILDTNIWLDWLLFNDASVIAIRNQVEKKTIQFIATPRMREELVLVLSRPQFLKHFNETRQPDHLLVEFDALVELVSPPLTLNTDNIDSADESKGTAKIPPHPLICKDPDDQIFIDLALAFSPCVLVSKDKLVLAVAKRLKKWLVAQGAENRPQVFICRPSEFAALPL